MTRTAGPAPARDASRARSAVAGLAAAVLSVRPLVGGMAAPVRVPVPGPALPEEQWAALAELLDRVAQGAGVPGLVLARGSEGGVFERVVGERLALGDVAAALPGIDPDEIDEIVVDTVAAGFDAVFGKARAISADGVPLDVYAGGPADGEAVVLVPACGMPASLVEPWLRRLARDRRVLTWESRGLFGGPADGEDTGGADTDGGTGDDGWAVDTGSQAADLVAVLDHHGVERAHVVGLCGGAVIALAAAADRPERVASLSLWHGAYTLAGDSPRTRFQNDLIELMGLAASSRAAARSVQAAFSQVALADAPAGLAHLVLHPFVSADRLHRYCRLNGTLARTDVAGYLPRVHQPALVVTGEHDRTAHPEGSRRVAAGLRRGSLRLDEHTDHAALFADAAAIEAAVEFIERAGRCRPNRGRVPRAGVGDRGAADRDGPGRDAPEERG